MNFGIELIAWVADLSVVELAGCVSSRMTQAFCQKASDFDLLKEAIKEKTKNSKQRKSKVSNHNTSKLVNTTNCKLFLVYQQQWWRKQED